MRVGFVISNASTVTPTHSTMHIARAVLAAGHGACFIEPWDFELAPGGRLLARVQWFEAADRSIVELVDALSRRVALRRVVELDHLDRLLLRMNPLDLSALTFAQHARARGVCVLNDPVDLLRTAHKSFLAELTDVSVPETLVTRSFSAAERFASGLPEGVVLKPARACGGKGVALVHGRRRAQLEPAFEAAAAAGDGYVVVQEYLSEAAEGERRILWLDGALIGAYRRERPPRDFRHNLKVGGVPGPTSIDAADRVLLAPLGPHLRRSGVWFAGVDVIGRRIVEVNTLNPGGVHYAEEFGDGGVAARIVHSLESRDPSANTNQSMKAVS